VRRQSARRGGAAGPPRNLPRPSAAGGLQWLAAGWNQSAELPRRQQRRRTLRRIRRGVALVLGLGLFGAMVFGGLFLITPSVANAPSLVRAVDSAHGVPYTGSPVPERFATALGTTALSRELARILYTRDRSGTLAGAEVYLLGMKLDMKYPAPTLMKMYADVAYFGHGWYGLKAASCGYFGTPPERLSGAQAAMLVRVMRDEQAGRPSLHLAHGGLTCKPRRHHGS
jgi:hypothetical protein